MESVLSIDNLFTLAMLILLQAVLGFDNLLYISIESKRVALKHQAMVRRLGIGLAIVLRIILLFVVLQAIELFQNPVFEIHWTGIVEGSFNVHALLVLVGGGFILYTAMKEIGHMLIIDEIGHDGETGSKSVAGAIFWIVSMNLIFSFDSILSAMALTKVFWVMAVAILLTGVLMIWLADHVSEFLKKNRMYEVLGLFILLIVGIMLLSEGGHISHLTLFGYQVEAMAKSTFYFVIAVMVLVDLVQSRYRKKLMAQAAAERGKPPA